jgi:hypothetical protein
MLSAERLTRCEARPHTPWPVHETARIPPFMPVAAGGLSGRPRCRIFPVGRLWVLQMETASAWFAGEGPVEPPPRLKFPTLAAAVAHAEWHGYDYRIIKPGPVARFAVDRHRRTPRKGQVSNGSGAGRNSPEH